MRWFYLADLYTLGELDHTYYDPFAVNVLSTAADNQCELSGEWREHPLLAPDLYWGDSHGAISEISYETCDTYNSPEITRWQLGSVDPFDPPVELTRFQELSLRGFLNVVRNLGGAV